MAKQTTENPLTVTPDRAADMLGIAPRKVREMIYSGELPSFKVGKRWLIPIRELEKWISDQVRQALKD